jgi:histidyl-tRNA synthetase
VAADRGHRPGAFRRAWIEEIRTPLLEVTELFARGIGEATDVVGKEMYTFLDRGDRSCTLRPEGTASVVRAAIQHGLLSQGAQRLWYGGPDVPLRAPPGGAPAPVSPDRSEFLGHADPRSDVEAIAIAWDLLIDLGLGVCPWSSIPSAIRRIGIATGPSW